VGDDGVAVIERQPEELATPPRLPERASNEYGLEVAGAGQMTPYRSWVEDMYTDDGAVDDEAGETRAYGLDFR
jgi:hypothetical protein